MLMGNKDELKKRQRIDAASRWIARILAGVMTACVLVLLAYGAYLLYAHLPGLVSIPIILFVIAFALFSSLVIRTD